jgi:hypothetical protein
LPHALEFEEDLIAGKLGRELEMFAIQTSPLKVPKSPPLWEMILRKESTSLKLCGKLTVVQAESSKPGDSAPGTSSRMNFQFRLKLNLARGDCGGA